MAKVSVTPETFTLVNFDGERLRSLVAQIADKVGLAEDTAIEIVVDEKTPATRAKVTSVDPIRIEVEGGAIEDPTVPRTLSDRLTADVIGRLLLRVADRRTPGFADAPADDDLDLPQRTAWDSYCMGRLERMGFDARKPRRLYHFRNRHGFSDVADRNFERLWAGEGLTWADLQAACDETASARAAVSA